MLDLLKFFEHFRFGNPYHHAAIAQLQEDLPQNLKDEDALWLQSWKAAGIEQQVHAPYYHQLSSRSGYGFRECFSAVAAMAAAFYSRVESFDAYNRIREDIGDTTSIDAQLTALRSLGISAEFRADGTFEDLENEIDAGRPIIVMYLHRGSVSDPVCNDDSCGHVLLVVGYNREELIVHDPMGMPDMIKGGHKNNDRADYVRIRRQAFKPRWEVEGDGTGWMIITQ
tara:strand:- start:204 stop:881 length:678 start_codon:yes stop_codon:yes gene_type:complete